MKKPRVVLFDADGVVITPPFRFVAYLKKELNLDMADTQDFFRGPFNACLVGEADLKSAIAPFLPRWGWHASVDKFLQCWFKEEHVFTEPMLPMIKALREHGIVCSMATNQERNRLHYMKTEMGFADLFDAVFGSSELGAAKPDLDFYERVTRKLNVPREEILFWDDSRPNVDAAREFGWQAEHYQTYEAFKDVMAAWFSFLN